MIYRSMFLLSFGFGGAESRLMKLASELYGKEDFLCVNEDFLRIAAGRRDIENVVKVLESNTRLIIIPKLKGVLSYIPYLKYLWVVLYSISLVLKYKPRVVHCALGGFFVSPFAYFFGSKVLCEFTSPDNVDKYSKMQYIFKSTRFICVSESVKSRAESKVASRQNYLVYPVPYYELKNESLIKSNYSIPNITFCARFIARKNAILFVRSMIELSNLTNKFSVTIMGDGPEEESVKELSTEINCIGAVSVGRVSNPNINLLSSQIFVSLIEPDNYPSQSVLEAMDCGCALVLSNTGTSKRYIKDNGLLVGLEAREVANSIYSILQDAQALNVYGQNSRKLLVEEFSKDKCVSYLEATYSDLVDDK